MIIHLPEHPSGHPTTGRVDDWKPRQVPLLSFCCVPVASLDHDRAPSPGFWRTVYRVPKAALDGDTPAQPWPGILRRMVPVFAGLILAAFGLALIGIGGV